MGYTDRAPFYGCTNLKTVEWEEGITTIPSQIFRGCTQLTSITIPNSVTTIGESAFKGCNNLSSIIIPNSVTTIEDEAFYGCTGATAFTYLGTRLQWLCVTIGSNNTPLTSATIHCSDDNGENIVNLIPNMTSNTAPYGTVNRSSAYSNTYEGYKAFDNTTAHWATVKVNSLDKEYISYTFKNEVTPYAVYIKGGGDGSDKSIKHLYVYIDNTLVAEYENTENKRDFIFVSNLTHIRGSTIKVEVEPFVTGYAVGIERIIVHGLDHVE
ncbi:MAG: leucine-rich repeat domain-containing protein [Clostridia bacterium]|nr:leucine-rich repeat domain-containing protein [Clostridia bacterium]